MRVTTTTDAGSESGISLTDRIEFRQTLRDWDLSNTSSTLSVPELDLYAFLSVGIDFKVERVPQLFRQEIFVRESQWSNAATRGRNDCTHSASGLTKHIPPSSEDRYTVSSTRRA